jgi:hypothetical protein
VQPGKCCPAKHGQFEDIHGTWNDAIRGLDDSDMTGTSPKTILRYSKRDAIKPVYSHESPEILKKAFITVGDHHEPYRRSGSRPRCPLPDERCGAAPPPQNYRPDRDS